MDFALTDVLLAVSFQGPTNAPPRTQQQPPSGGDGDDADADAGVDVDDDDDAVAQLSAQYTEVVERLTVKLDKGGTQAIMAEINKKNNAINDANLSRTAAEAVARAKSGKKDESMNDPFSRRPTRMASISHLPHSAD